MRFIYTKGFAVFFGTLALAAIAAFSFYKGWLGPIQRAALQLPRPVNYLLSAAVRPTKAFISNAYNLRNIVKENARLREEVVRLKNRQALFDQIILENELLRRELEFSKTSQLTLKLCAVLGRSPTGLMDSITIDCGAESGSAVGKAVVFKGYLVGKISYVQADFSVVQLIVNSGLSVDARISQSGQLAIVRGSFNSGLVLEQVPQSEFLEKGMLVVTAGLNDKTPKNLLIGEIDEMLSAPNDLFKKTSLISPIDFSDLDFVFLVQ